MQEVLTGRELAGAGAQTVGTGGTPCISQPGCPGSVVGERREALRVYLC